MDLNRYLLNNLFTGTFEIQQLIQKSFELVTHYYTILLDLSFKYEQSDLA